MKPPIIRDIRVWLALSCLFIFVLTFFSLNKDSGSDPKLTLFVAQALLDHGSVRLDPYLNESILDQPFATYLANGSIIKTGGEHYYNYYPLGPSIISLPVVWIARLLGQDMRMPQSYQIQNWLASFTVVAIFLLIYFTGRYFLDDWSSFTIAIVSVLGSSLVSTLGTAWWSLNPATLFIGLALWLLVRQANGRSCSPYLLGMLLFLAFFARAGTAPFIVVVLVYLFWQDRRLFWPTALTAALLLAILLLWSRAEYGQWLPAYYTVARLQAERVPTWVGVAGNLLSPSRGLLFFSPFFILTLIGIIWLWRDLRRQPLFWLCVTWFALQLWLIARAASWWGGASFGPRLLTDALLALVLLTILVWQAAVLRLSRRGYRLALFSYLGLGILAALLHVGQGLYSRPASLWNFYIQPRPAASAEGWGDLFNWRYTQLLATNEMLCRIEQDKMITYLPEDQTLGFYYFGQRLAFRADQTTRYNFTGPDVPEPVASQPSSPPGVRATLPYRYHLPLFIKEGNMALFEGWSNPEADFRWSRCPSASLLFRLGEAPREGAEYALVLQAGAFGPQSVLVELNGEPLGSLTLSGDGGAPEINRLPLDPALLRPLAHNRLTFHFSNPHYPRPYWADNRLQFDQRLLAMSLYEMRLEEAGADLSPVPENNNPAYP